MDKLVNEQNRDVQNNRSQMTSEVRRHETISLRDKTSATKSPPTKTQCLFCIFKVCAPLYVCAKGPVVS